MDGNRIEHIFAEAACPQTTGGLNGLSRFRSLSTRRPLFNSHL